MRIFEILGESEFNSSETWFIDQQKILKAAIDNFDDVIRLHGTAGANVYFGKITHNIDEIDWIMKPRSETNPKYTKQYNKMNELKDELQTKIKNSGGLSY